MNPHFLFNALHSLAVLVRRDQAAAQVAIEQLGELLRYTLSETDGDEVRLSEEWRFTKTYLDLEQIDERNHRRREPDLVERAAGRGDLKPAAP